MGYVPVMSERTLVAVSALITALGAAFFLWFVLNGNAIVVDLGSR